MKKEYVEIIPAKRINHKIIVCENPDCEKVIKDGKELLELHLQMGDGKKLHDFCSEKCAREYVRYENKKTKVKR